MTLKAASKAVPKDSAVYRSYFRQISRTDNHHRTADNGNVIGRSAGGDTVTLSLSALATPGSLHYCHRFGLFAAGYEPGPVGIAIGFRHVFMDSQERGYDFEEQPKANLNVISALLTLSVSPTLFSQDTRQHWLGEHHGARRSANIPGQTVMLPAPHEIWLVGGTGRHCVALVLNDFSHCQSQV